MKDADFNSLIKRTTHTKPACQSGNDWQKMLMGGNTNEAGLTARVYWRRHDDAYAVRVSMSRKLYAIDDNDRVAREC